MQRYTTTVSAMPAAIETGMPTITRATPDQWIVDACGSTRAQSTIAPISASVMLIGMRARHEQSTTPTATAVMRTKPETPCSAKSTTPTPTVRATCVPIVEGTWAAMAQRARAERGRFLAVVHGRPTRDVVQLFTPHLGKAPRAGAFAEPSDGLEPSTPSLPCAAKRLPWVATGCGPACLSGFRGCPICHRLPPVAPAGLHTCSIQGENST
jgi:hypothetical protein